MKNSDSVVSFINEELSYIHLTPFPILQFYEQKMTEAAASDNNE